MTDNQTRCIFVSSKQQSNNAGAENLKSDTMNTANLPQKLTDIVIARVQEMVQNPQIQEIMMTFEIKEDAVNWVYKAAIATLIGVQND